MELSPSGSRASRARRSALLDTVRQQGEVEVTEVRHLFGVSLETIRRDLRFLEDQGLVRRTYGRVFAAESGTVETALDVRPGINPEEKARVASAVVSRLGDAQSIFLDEGYQTQLIAQRLPLDRQLTVVTTSLPIATLLAARPSMQVIILGGRVRGNTLGVVDTWASAMLGEINVDLAIMGANGVTIDRGMTTPDQAVAAVKSAAMKCAARRIFVSAHHKFGRTTFVTFAQTTDFEEMITGHELPAPVVQRFRTAGANLLLV